MEDQGNAAFSGKTASISSASNTWLATSSAGHRAVQPICRRRKSNSVGRSTPKDPLEIENPKGNREPPEAAVKLIAS